MRHYPIDFQKGRCKMDKYIYWLDNVPGLGDGTKIRLLEAFQTGEEVYQAKEKHLRCILEEKKLDALLNGKIIWDLDRKYEEFQKKNIQMVMVTDERFPINLKNIPDPPFCLYYKGMLPDDRLPGVAIIGARECSEYGRYVARELGKCLGENQINVISGMAAGIDGISQSAALEAGGKSYAVLGCGVDVCYPKSNRQLYDSLVESGGVISAYPLGTQPLRQLFPPRNRIVSGLADVVVVIEARQKSGTSITVDMALEQGKDIFAVPGRVTDRLSDGCNKMLRDGAHVFLSPQDFLKEMEQLVPGKMALVQGLNCLRNDDGRNISENGIVGSEKYKMVQAVLDFYPQYVDVIAERLRKEYGWNISIAKLNVLLMQMCLLDNVKQESPGWFSKNGL